MFRWCISENFSLKVFNILVLIYEFLLYFISFSVLELGRPLDLVFVIDSSQEVTDSILEKMKEFIVNHLRSYNVSSSGTHVSLVAYGNKNEVLLPLQDGITLTALKASLTRLKKIGGERRLATALNTVRNDVLTAPKGLRDDSAKLVTVLITGPSTPLDPAPLRRESDALKQNDVKVTVIGIGPNVKEDQIQVIASDPDNIVKVDTVNDLHEATPVLASAAKSKTGEYIL